LRWRLAEVACGHEVGERKGRQRAPGPFEDRDHTRPLQPRPAEHAGGGCDCRWRCPAGCPKETDSQGWQSASTAKLRGSGDL